MPTGSTPPANGPTGGSTFDRSRTTLTSEGEVRDDSGFRNPRSPAVSTGRDGADPGLPAGTVDLYWIPLGAGAHVVKASGALFEMISALLHHRRRCSLYHSALVIHVPEGRFVIEQAPV